MLKNSHIFSVARYGVSKREYCTIYTHVSFDRLSFSVLEVIFIRELASRLPDTTPVIACTVNPGYCVSKLTRNIAARWIMAVFRTLFFVRSAEEGSRALVHAAVASDRSMHGRYLSCCQVTEESDFLFTAEGKAFSARVWVRTIAIGVPLNFYLTEPAG